MTSSEMLLETSWSHIYWLCVLHATGSYTAAARRLGVSKAAVSQRVSELEQRLGITLVTRTTRSVRLTDAGLALVRTTEPAFALIEEGCDAVRDLTHTEQGVIRMTVPVALGRQEVLPVISSYLAKYPLVRIELELSDHLSGLSQEGFDLAIRHTNTIPDNYVAWLLRSTRTVLVATPRYIQQHPTIECPQDLTQHNCLYYARSGNAPVWSFRQADRPAERYSVPVKGRFSANNSEALRTLVLDHAGVALLPDFSASPWMASGDLVQLLPAWEPVDVFGHGIYAIRPFSAYVPKAIRSLVEHVRQHLSGRSCQLP